MAEVTWKKAIIKVLEEEKKALHYTEIAELIAEKGYRENFGATPQDTVSARMTTDINKKGEKSVFAKVDRGVYILRKLQPRIWLRFGGKNPHLHKAGQTLQAMLDDHT